MQTVHDYLTVAQEALQQYRQEVASGQFPGARYSPYSLPESELKLLVESLRDKGAHDAAQAVEQAARDVA
jgi:hypothetical protein